MSYYLLYQLFVYSRLLSYFCCSSCSASCLPSKRVFMFLILIFCFCLGHSSPLGTFVISFGVIPIFCLLSNLYLVLFPCSYLCLWIFVKCVFFLLVSCFLSSSSFLLLHYRLVFHFRSIYLCHVPNSLSLLCYPFFVSYLSRLLILLTSLSFLLSFSLLLFLTLSISFVPPNFHQIGVPLAPFVLSLFHYLFVRLYSFVPPFIYYRFLYLAPFVPFFILLVVPLFFIDVVCLSAYVPASISLYTMSL